MSEASLRDMVVIVTGGAQGIGRCIATAMAGDGATVVVADIQEDRADEVAATLRDVGLQAWSTFVDIRSPASALALAAATIDRFGQVDVLVNNAGIDAPPGRPWSVDDAHWCEVIDTDLSGAWWCTRAVLPHMMERGEGRIIFISSGSARRGSPEISVAYNAAKAGLIGLTVGLSVHLEPHGILVNAIAPGPTGTGTPMSPEEIDAHTSEFPLGIGGPEPVAHACLYLARASGDWVSGSVLNVSGGWWRGY